MHAHIAMGMAADCKAALEALLLKLTPLADQTFLQECMSYKRSDRAAYDIQNKISITKHRIHPVTLFDSINRLAPEDAIFTIEVGSAIIWANNLLQVNGKQRFIWSSNLATLGFALPAGIGAKLCMKDRPSIIIAGDGSFDMLISDFITAVKYKAPIICLVLNNRALRFSGSDENLESAAHFGTQLDNPDFSALAKAMGGDGAKVQTLDELDGALEIAFKTQVPYILDIYLEPNAKPVPPLINPKMNLAFATSRFKRFFSKLHNGNNSTEHVN